MTYGAVITLDTALFRTRFPQFANTTTFPNATLDVQWLIATQYISDTNYGGMVDTARELAIQLMLAHLMALGVIIGTTGTGVPGLATSATIDKVSVTMAAPPYGTSEWRYWLNLTPYGTQLLALLGAQSVGGGYYGGLPERAAFRKVGGWF